MTNKSPFLREFAALTPLPFSFSFEPFPVPAFTSRITFPSIVGISFLLPSVASVIVSGTSKYKSLFSLSKMGLFPTLNSM